MAGKRTHKVWDLPIRLFHWILVLFIAVLWLTGEFGGLDVTLSLPVVGVSYFSNMDIHALAGQGVFILVLFRLLWGVWGSTTARFSHFIRKPSVVIAKASDLIKGRVSVVAGHNPLGGVMVVLLLVVLALQSITGLFAADDLLFEGPLSHLVSDEIVEKMVSIHHLSFTVLEVLIILHVLAILFYRLRGQNLITAMFTGKQKLDAAPGLQFPSGWLSLVTILIALGILLILRSL